MFSGGSVVEGKVGGVGAVVARAAVQSPWTLINWLVDSGYHVGQKLLSLNALGSVISITTLAASYAHLSILQNGYVFVCFTLVLLWFGRGRNHHDHTSMCSSFEQLSDARICIGTRSSQIRISGGFLG